MEEYTKKTIDVILYNLVYFDYHNKNLTKNESNRSSCRNLRKKMVMLAGEILVKT